MSTIIDDTIYDKFRKKFASKRYGFEKNILFLER